LERKEAVALLKELITGDLAQPFLVSLNENKRGKFDLVVKDDCNIQAIRRFALGKNFHVEVDEEKGYCFIHKP